MNEYKKIALELRNRSLSGQLGGGNPVGYLFSLLLVGVVGSALAPTIGNSFGGSDIQNNSNFSSATKSIANIIPLTFMLVIVSIFAAPFIGRG